MKFVLLKETEFENGKIPFYGNKYLTGNGYFGIRGTMEEYKKDNMPAVNLAGIYDKVGHKWRESVNAPNPLFTYVKVDHGDGEDNQKQDNCRRAYQAFTAVG